MKGTADSNDSGLNHAHKNYIDAFESSCEVGDQGSEVSSSSPTSLRRSLRQ